MTRKPIEFRQLCALTRAVLQKDPTIDDAEWKARVRDQMAKWRFDEVDAAMLGRAMGAVEQAMRFTMGPRPTPVLQGTKPPPTPAPPIETGRTHRPAGWDLVVTLMATLESVACASSSPPPPREVLAISEVDAVNEFWRATREPGAYRVAILRAFAEIAIVRPAGWNPAAIRARANEHHLSAAACFGCGRGEGLAWHHVIQVQHGGSNYARNRVALCGSCHSDVHPWLPREPRRLAGWSSLADIYNGAAIGKQEKRA